MSEQKKNEVERARMVASCENRRKKLDISLRGFSREAGLEPSYYGHWISGQFMFPSAQKLRKIHDALDRLEQLAAFRASLTERA